MRKMSKNWWPSLIHYMMHKTVYSRKINFEKIVYMHTWPLWVNGKLVLHFMCPAEHVLSRAGCHWVKKWESWGRGWGKCRQLEVNNNKVIKKRILKSKRSLCTSPYENLMYNVESGPIKWHWSDKDSIKYVEQSEVTPVNQKAVSQPRLSGSRGNYLSQKRYIWQGDPPCLRHLHIWSE